MNHPANQEFRARVEIHWMMQNTRASLKNKKALQKKAKEMFEESENSNQ